MQPVTKQISDEQRWLALFLRNACAPKWSLRKYALSYPSMMTIEKRMRMDAAHGNHDDVELFKRDINHKTLMIKIGMRLGLGARELSL